MPRKKCECGTSIPSYNITGQKRGKWCGRCPNKPPNAINVVSRRCECGISQPSLNIAGQKQGKWCSHCPDKPPNAIDVVSRKCECGISKPALNIIGEKQGKWCSSCPNKSPNAINVVNRKCECGKSQPSLNIIGEKQGKWCSHCPNKAPNAVDVINRKCECGTSRPLYNITGQKQAKWCSHCPNKPPNAINVVTRKCECGKSIPSYNIAGQKQRKWCSHCPNKPPNAIAVVSRKCQCGASRPRYNITGQKQGKWCSHCPSKPANAINVASPKCECGKSAHYNIVGYSSAFCSNCLQPGMTLNPMKRCKECKNLAIFGTSERLRCENHKFKDDINLVERKCAKCGLEEVLDASALCKNCNPALFTKIKHSKELHIRDVLLANDFVFVHDKIANGSECGKERPDFVFYHDSHIVILEVDENQHSTYPCECEQIRMINITQTFGGMPVLWMRYNPDAYHKDGQLVKVSLRQREAHLIQWLKWSRDYQSQHLAEVLYLFYDECNQIASMKDIQVLS